MKKILFLCAVSTLFSLCAEILVWQDNLKKNTWISADKKTPFPMKNGVLTTSNKSYLLGEIIRSINPGASNLPGNKLKFSIEAKGKGEIQLGIWNYQSSVRQKWGRKIRLTGEFKTYSVEYTLDRAAPSVRCLIKGAGEFRNAKLFNMRKKGYAIVAMPAYQMYNKVPEKVNFTLFKDGIPVPGAKLTVNGNSASDPESGTVAVAYAQKGNTLPFDNAAKKIKLDKKLNILYLGDSLTHFDQGFNHADKTVYFLNKFNPGKAVLFNCAVRGDTCSMTLGRMQGKYKDRYISRFADFKKNRYDIAFIFLGQNDTRAHVNHNYKNAFVPPERQKKNYVEMIKILRAMGTPRIIIISCASLDEARLKAQAVQMAKLRPKKHALYGKPVLLEQFNRVSQQIAKELNVEYLDIYNPMKVLPGKPSYFVDGVHLSRKGHDFVALKTLEYLAAHQK